ncbi:MAG: helix-turn-helix domain-containing protein [Rhodothermaceae bacterium]|nr:helix-turn-helix domain-containing protein [Rhodothermaceae bacterium]
MMRFVLVIPSGENSPLAITGVSTIFNLAKRHGLSLHFQIVSAQDSKTIDCGYLNLTADAHIDEDLNPDIIILPSVVGDPEASLALNAHLVSWLDAMRKRRSKIASLCTGAYLLAKTGLLDGMEASSHCQAIPDLQKRFPRVNWLPEKIITDTKGLYTSGGTLSSFNLIVYLLAKYFDRQTAHQIARFIQIDYPRSSQKPFFIVSNQKNHGDELILNIQNYLEEHAASFVNLDTLSWDFGLSRRSLNRRFKAATGDTPRTYIQRIKVEQVKQWLESENSSISEVIQRIGYSDEKAFRALFKKMSGCTPSEYQKKFNQLYTA